MPMVECWTAWLARPGPRAVRAGRFQNSLDLYFALGLTLSIADLRVWGGPGQRMFSRNRPAPGRWCLIFVSTLKERRHFAVPAKLPGGGDSCGNICSQHRSAA